MALTEFASVILITSLETILTSPNGELFLAFYNAPVSTFSLSESATLHQDNYDNVLCLELNDPPQEGAVFEPDPDDFVFEADELDPHPIPTSSSSPEPNPHGVHFTLIEKIRSLMSRWALVDWFGAQLAITAESNSRVSSIAWFMKSNIIQKMARLASIPSLDALPFCLTFFSSLLNAFPDAG